MKRVRNSLVVCFIAFNFFCSIPSASAEEVTTIVTQGGDDSSYLVPLTVPVIYDGTTYQNVYATTNSVITFGNPDGTYWAYPQTPSISIESRDWWALPYYMPDTHFIISVSAGGFQVDGAYRPYGTWTGDVTSIVVTAQIHTDGTVGYTYAVQGPLSGDERTGARLTNGTVVTLEEAGVTQVEQAPVLEPTPVDPIPEPEPVVPEPVPVDPLPAPVPQPSQPQIQFPIPEPELPVPSEVIPEVPVEPEVQIEPLPEPIEEQPVTPLEPPVEEEPTVAEPLAEGEVLLDNGVVLSASQAVAVELLNNPGELIQEIFTNPMAALAALGQVGADMSPEVRERSEEVVVAAVIVGNIASAAGAAAYRRKP